MMFINYSVNAGISINSFRQPSGYANSEVTGLVDDILAERDGCCPLDGAKSALEDGALWAGSDATAEVLEMVHSAICEWELVVLEDVISGKKAVRPAAKALVEYIGEGFGGSQRAFAKVQRVAPQQVTQWINKGFIVVDDKLYSFRRGLK